MHNCNYIYRSDIDLQHVGIYSETKCAFIVWSLKRRIHWDVDVENKTDLKIGASNEKRWKALSFYRQLFEMIAITFRVRPILN